MCLYACVCVCVDGGTGTEKKNKRPNSIKLIDYSL